jgi:hypothetical protein
MTTVTDPDQSMSKSKSRIRLGVEASLATVCPIDTEKLDYS